MLRDQTPWAKQAQLVLVTAEGQAAPSMDYDILQPLLNQRVQTWADFSARLPAVPVRAWVEHAEWCLLPAVLPALWSPLRVNWIACPRACPTCRACPPSPHSPHPYCCWQAPGGSGYLPVEHPSAGRTLPPLSFEGGPQRCFRQLFVCERGINITRWPLHKLGLRLVKHYQQRNSERLAAAVEEQQAALQQQQQAQGGLPKIPWAAQAAADAAAAAVSDRSRSGKRGKRGSKGERELRIVFHKRSNSDQRQLLNAAELIERCNAWRHTTAEGVRLQARCWETEPTDLFTGMAAAQAADIFVGVHGECVLFSVWGWIGVRCDAAYTAAGRMAEGPGLCWVKCLLSSPTRTSPRRAVCLLGWAGYLVISPACTSQGPPLRSPPALVPGANMANGWLMRPGSSMIELQVGGLRCQCSRAARVCRGV